MLKDNDLPPVFRPKDNRPVPTNPATYEQQDKLQAYGEYRAHGGKLDFTAWEEKNEAEENL